MTETGEKRLLIVECVAGGSDRLEELLAYLSRKHDLDPYTARQRLIGQGTALFAKGGGEKLEEIAALLDEYGIENWLIEPTRPRFAPARIRGLKITEDAVLFSIGEKGAALHRGDRVVAVLADLSGKIVEKSLKRLMAQKIYRGEGGAESLDEAELCRQILLSQPVLDLYLLGEKYKARAALRVFPGKFDHRGLGKRATLSAAGNLEKVLELAREYAGEFTLRADFGLSALPGCRLSKAEDGGDWQRDNLAALTRYGWLMADLELAEKTRRGDEVDPTAGEAVLAASAGLQAPLLAAAVAAEGAAPPGFEELAAELQGEDEEKEEAASSTGGLPAPPPFESSVGFRWRKDLFGYGGAAALLVLLLTGGEGRAFEFVYRYGVLTGVFPGILSCLCLWGGFYYLRMKRRVENTPTSRTRSVAMGLVEVQGRARRKYALVSPMSQMPVVYYRLRKYRRDPNKGWRITSDSDSGAVPFYLEDDTGRVSVDPAGATVRARTREQGTAGQMNMLFASSAAIDNDEKWVEEVIPEGTFLYVLGSAGAAKKEHQSLRERTALALRDLKLDGRAMKKFDADGDGRISQDEWEEARAHVEEEVLHRSLAEKEGPSRREDLVVIGRPKSRSLPFVIAETESEAHLTRNYSLFTVPLFLGALLGVLWAVAILTGS